MRASTVEAAGMLPGRQSCQILNAAWSTDDVTEHDVLARSQPTGTTPTGPTVTSWCSAPAR
ncbi:hypothetical protein [Spongiactinospora sp. 9N601]|uniref:hypothetical protein n=1 Tax=Spongiactinospora sp. 9N601 TaxID=3375149 RepID=UPI0037B9460A